MTTTFAGLDLDGTARLEAALRAASHDLEREAGRASSLLHQVGQAAHAPGDLKAVAGWCHHLARDIRRRRHHLERDLAAAAGSKGFRHLPCDDLARAVEDQARTSNRRFLEHLADPRDLRRLRPVGEFSYLGHRDAMDNVQRGGRNRLEWWDEKCTGAGGAGAAAPSAWARAELGRDYETELPPLPPEAAREREARRRRRGLHLDLPDLGGLHVPKVSAGGAAAATGLGALTVLAFPEVATGAVGVGTAAGVVAVVEAVA